MLCPMCCNILDSDSEVFCRCGYFFKVKSRENYKV